MICSDLQKSFFSVNAQVRGMPGAPEIEPGLANGDYALDDTNR